LGNVVSENDSPLPKQSSLTLLIPSLTLLIPSGHARSNRA
jgi:hypothetical protein